MQNSNPPKPPVIIIQFNPHNNLTLNKFKTSLAANNIAIRQMPLDKPNRINIYFGIYQQSSARSQIDMLTAKYCPHLVKPKINNDKFIVSIIYQQDKQQVLEKIPKVRTILLRECLPEIINFHYQIETTLNQMESLKHLINTVLNISAVEESKNLSYFDQKLTKFNSTSENVSHKDPKQVWKNMIYQIQRMEAGVVQPLVQKFPTVESLYRDLGGPRTIENLTSTNQMDQEKKIKKSTLKRIQQIFLSMEADQKLND